MTIFNPMRQLFAILMVLCLLVQTGSKTLIYFSWLSNQDYIAKNLCENRDKPQMKCCGKCHLHKQMQQDDRHQNVPNKVKSLDEVVMINGNEEVVLKFTFESEKVLFTDHSTGLLSAFRKGVFHPPTFTC